jgi:hypothetical protein
VLTLSVSAKATLPIGKQIEWQNQALPDVRPIITTPSALVDEPLIDPPSPSSARKDTIPARH